MFQQVPARIVKIPERPEVSLNEEETKKLENALQGAMVVGGEDYALRAALKVRILLSVIYFIEHFEYTIFFRDFFHFNLN